LRHAPNPSESTIPAGVSAAPLLFGLDFDPQQVSVEEVGQKAHSLMVLNRLGLPVPPGVVLSAQTQRVCQAEASLLADLVAALPQIPGQRLMVRSSAVGEDGPTTSFAGQLDSFQVDNDPAAIVVGIERCWASAENARLAAYSVASEVQLGGLAVIVQQLVEPDYAGVYFTAHPTEEGCELLEYVEGHCEKLVQGEVTPESIKLPSDEPLPFEVTALREAGARIREHLQAEQDIEWLVQGGSLFLVQSRPITARRRAIAWSSTNVNENYPEPLSPLLHSIARRAYYHYFKSLSERFALIRNGEGEQYFANIIGTWGERMYYNMSHVHAVIALSPLGAALGPAFDDFVGYQAGTARPERKWGRRRKLGFAARGLREYRQLPQHVRKIEARVAAFAAEEIKQESLPRLFHEFLDIRFNFWVHASYADFFAMSFHGLLGRFLEDAQLEKARGLQNTLLQSIPGLVSNEPIFSLWALKQLAKSEDLLEDCIKADAELLWGRIQNDARYAKLRLAVEQHLHNWGYRCTGELTFLGKNHIEDPLSFLRMLRTYLATEDVDPHREFAAMRAQQQQAMKDACAEIGQRHSILRAAKLRWQLRRLVRAASNSIAARERVRLKQAQMYFKLKQVCLAFGDELASHSVLKQAEDVFFLEYDEISRLLNFDELSGGYWRELIALRRAKWSSAIEKGENLRSFAFAFDDNSIDLDKQASASAEGGMTGLPACGGVVRGRAVVLASIHEADQLHKGDILVTRQTDPGWICAFPLISGLVVERGGMLSHGAIVAREFGIPAVVGVKGITETIRTGELIEVDGNHGTVRRLGEEVQA
jgi:rifampicin phosphotransferase